MSNYAVGHAAEKVAAEFLRKNGFKVHELNWKTRLCEIDIVAEKDGCICFVEVKHRKNNNQGTGLYYITSGKLRKMELAAELWVSAHIWRGPYQLSAVSIDDGQITFLDRIDV